jgi:hypothetical protein
MDNTMTTAEKKQYDKCLAEHFALNNSADVCTTEKDYETLKIQQQPQRNAINARINAILAKTKRTRWGA